MYPPLLAESILGSILDSSPYSCLWGMLPAYLVVADQGPCDSDVQHVGRISACLRDPS